MCLPVCVYNCVCVCMRTLISKIFLLEKLASNLASHAKLKTHTRAREREREREEGEREMAADCSHNIRECINLHGKTRT